jgi:hypothetical protein
MNSRIPVYFRSWEARNMVCAVLGDEQMMMTGEGYCSLGVETEGKIS